ncbi:type VI secretion system tip protein VgrG [Pseudenhygromyxa sp. WMMC2535]|uniref:type VI secretion system Vgr family protein n=1 Tax=Pseudenhygromyxa sp. WMMC2535 TaxID=2712867 RepID=UPI001551A628|nr:type VI secretion system tip protein TssI/VgrG [Pseudenhygromyxa sp. WMMC2535]NVB42449.1 type VI secretion system tip protein VgrG [Pseudenhygromyxa sp. WMMC2535]
MSDSENSVALRFDASADVDGTWKIENMSIRQRFNEPGAATIKLHSQDLMAEPSLMLGTSATVVIERAGAIHEFSGIIERVEDGVGTGHELVATVTMVPALVALRHRKNSRIFQEMTIPEILEQVLGEGLGAYERAVDLGYLSGKYSTQEYTVQYQETDFDFVHRLMEEHGIGYHFIDSDGKEVMTLHDSDAVYVDLLSLGNSDGMLPLVSRGDDAGLTEDLREFRRMSKLRSTVVRTKVFNWLSPSAGYDGESVEAAELETANGASLEPEREEYIHDEPSGLSSYRSAGLEPDDVDHDLAIRRAVHQRDAIRCAGASTAIAMAPGARFELLDHPQPDMADQYVVVAVEHRYGSHSLGVDGYSNIIECIPSEVEWRPERRRRRPRMPSLQTATVVGPAGEEIHTDEHGRIKVQFHWDREGQNDENSSCFVRVVQPWAGNGWGFVFLPRIGMEVAVNFIEGDPDRPMVMGCVYNGDNVPPYGLPGDKTKSTVKSNSSPGGGGFNELRFEDASGSEEIFIHAQKDFNETVLNDHNTTVGNNQTNNVDVDQTQTVHGNQSETVDGNQDMSVGGNRSVVVSGDFSEEVSGSESRTVTGNVSEDFAANETRTVAGNHAETVTGNVDQTVSGNVSQTISGNLTDTVSGSMSETITGGITTTTPANLAVTAAGGINMTTTGSFLVNAAGGFTVLAPGGTKTVDQDFWSFGGGQGAIFGFAIGYTGAKAEYTGVAMGMTGIKLEVTGFSNGQTGVIVKDRGLEFENAGLAAYVAAAKVYNAAMNIIG